MPASILEIYRRTQPNPLGKVFRKVITLAAAMNTTLTPSAGKIILLDKIVMVATANLASTVTWEIRSTVAGATGMTGVYNDAGGAAYMSIGGATLDLMFAGFDTFQTLNMSSLATNLVMATMHARPPIKLTESEGITVIGTGGTLSVGTANIVLQGWFLNNATDY